MVVPRKAARNLWAAATFIILEAAAIAILGASNSYRSVWVNSLSCKVKAWLWSGGTRARAYIGLNGKNRELSAENALLWDELQRYRTLERRGRTDSLDTLDPVFECQLAQIVKLSTNGGKNYFIIDKGSEDGVYPHCGVVTAKGVVGVTDIVSAHMSYGRTLQNTQTTVSARLGHSSVIGTLSWDGIHDDTAVLQPVPLHTQVNPSDTVWTSGYSELFPSDMPLGVVTGERIRNGAAKEVTVRLFQDFSSLEFVYVLKARHHDEIIELEERGEQL